MEGGPNGRRDRWQRPPDRSPPPVTPLRIASRRLGSPPSRITLYLPFEVGGGGVPQVEQALRRATRLRLHTPEPQPLPPADRHGDRRSRCRVVQRRRTGRGRRRHRADGRGAPAAGAASLRLYAATTSNVTAPEIVSRSRRNGLSRPARRFRFLSVTQVSSPNPSSWRNDARARAARVIVPHQNSADTSPCVEERTRSQLERIASSRRRSWSRGRSGERSCTSEGVSPSRRGSAFTAMAWSRTSIQRPVRRLTQ